MNSTPFDNLIRSFTQSRRTLFGGMLVAAAGYLAMPGVDAKKKRKHQKRKPKARPNEFGCLEVGDPCKNSAHCCSGICEGKKCRAHDTGTCKQDGQLVPCNNRTNCGCFTTTAGSDICAELFPPSECAACQRDADCEALGFPLGSACAPYDCPSGTACMVPCRKAPPAV